MADILLAHCNHLHFDRKQVRKMQPYPPLQTLIAAAALRQAGHSVAVFDATFAAPLDGFQRALRQHRPRVIAICEDNFNFLTKMCLTQSRELSFQFSEAARQAGVPIVVNSSDASDHLDEYLRHGFDYVIRGELENTLCALVESLLKGERADSLPGLQLTPPRAPIADLDVLPAPAWDLIDVAPYRDAWVAAHGYFSLNMVTSRGCPYHCNWCAKPLYGQTYRVRSAKLIAEEMCFVKTALAPDHLWFADDIFALNEKWTAEFAESVEALDARIPFKIQSRCDLMTRGSVAALRRAGLEEVWMGVESGSQRILDAMEKGISVQHARTAVENLRAHRIRTCFFLQFGFPGETWNDIDCTVRLIREIQPDDIGVSVSYPLPGTKFHSLVALQLNGKKNWSDSDDLAMMFRGAYSSEFYRALRDALHLEVDLQHGCVNSDAPLQLRNLWTHVEQLEKTCRNPDPTPLWNSC